MKTRQRVFYTALFSCAILLIALSLVQVILGFNKDVRTSTYKVLQQINDQYSAAVDDSLNEKYSVLNGLAKAVVHENAYLDKDVLYKMVLPLINMNEFSVIGFADNNGTVYSSIDDNQLESATDDSQQTIINRQYFKTAMAGKRAIERLGQGKLSGEPRTVLAVPVYSTGSSEETVIGVVFASFTDEAFLKLFQPISYSDEASVIITDADGNVILSSSHSGVSSGSNIRDVLESSTLTDMNLSQALSDIDNAHSFSCTIVTSDKTERYIRMLPFPVNDWLLFSTIPNSAVSESNNLFARRAAVLFTELLLIAAANLTAVMIYGKKQKRILADEKELLRQSEERYRIVSDFSGSVLYEGNYSQDLITFNSQFADLFGREPEELHISSYQSLKKCIHPEDFEIFKKTTDAFLHGAPYFELDFRVLAKDQYSWIRSECQNIFDENDKPLRFLGKITIVDKEYSQINELVEKAERDPLTNLYNRSGANAKIAPYLSCDEGSATHAFMLFDIDKFKFINDEYGHMEGDSVLKEFSKILSNSVRASDIVCRIGGDEFVVFMPSVESTRNINECAERIVRTLELRKCNQFTTAFTISFGISQWSKDGLTFNDLYKAADDALYKVKADGGNGYRLAGN